LDASYNELSAVPDDLGRGVKLQRLLLKANVIELNTAFWFENLTSLVELDIRDNQITALPVTIGMLTQLQVLRVEGHRSQFAAYRYATHGILRQSTAISAAGAGAAWHEGRAVLLAGGF
jgi:hypothetical protein